jgi:DNA polymerase-3 subunit gamma/tau
VAKVGGESERLFDLSEHYIQQFKKESENFSETDLLRMIKTVVDLNYTLKRTTEPRIHLEVALLRLIQMDSSVSIETLLEKLGQAGSEGGGIEYKAPPKKEISRIKDSSEEENSESEENLKPPDQNSLPLNLENLKAGWSDVLSKVKEKKASLWSCLSHAEIVSLDNGLLLLEFSNGNEFHKKHVEKKENLKEIREIMNQVFQSDFRLNFLMNEKRTNSQQKNSVARSDFHYQDIPGLKEIIDNLGGEIIDKKPI